MKTYFTPTQFNTFHMQLLYSHGENSGGV